MLWRHLKVFLIAAGFAAIAYGIVHLLFYLTRGFW